MPGAITHEKKLPSGAWLVVALLFFVGALNYIDRIMITTMRTSLVEAMSMTDAQFGLLTAVFLWTYGLLSPFAGFLADRFNRSRVIIVSLFVWSLATWLTSYSKTFEQMLAARVLMGISEACYLPASFALIVDYHRTTTRSIASGIHDAGITVGASLGFLGGWIAEKYQWNVAFIIFGVIGIIYSVVLIFILKDAPQNRPDVLSGKVENNVDFFEGIKDLFKRKYFIMIIAFWGLAGVVGWLVMGWLPTYYKEHFSLSQGVSGMYATAFLYPATIVGLLLGGFLADRWCRTNPRGRILVPAIGFCVATPCIFMASYTAILPLAIILFMFYAITQAFTNANIMPILCLVVDSRYRATAFGVMNMFGTIIGGIGLYAAGVLRDVQIDLSRMFQVAAMLMVICAVLLFIIKPESESGK